MSLRIGDTAPDFKAKTTQGEIRFHDWIGDNYTILFSHPKDFTPVCTTELGTMASMVGQFKERGCKVRKNKKERTERVLSPEGRSLSDA